MIEQTIIDGKLTQEGIDVALGNGIQFETEEALGAWVGTAKTFAMKPKAIEEYTAEELEEMLKDPAPKAKGLQGLADKIRSKSKVPAGVTPPKDKFELPEEVAAKLAKIDQITNEMEEAKKQSLIDKRNAYIESKTKDFDPIEVELLKNALPTDAQTDDIDKRITEYRSLMVKRGLKGYTSQPSSGGNGLSSDWSDSVKKFNEAKNKNKK